MTSHDIYIFVYDVSIPVIFPLHNDDGIICMYIYIYIYIYISYIYISYIYISYIYIIYICIRPIIIIFSMCAIII